MEELDKRLTSTWSKPPASSNFLGFSRAHAWSSVIMTEADRLPYMQAEGMSHLKVNQFCEDCTVMQLCATHEPMARNDNVDLNPAHQAAIVAAGYCMIECGGEGDCFYHSMLFLAKLFRKDLFDKWVNHRQLREQSCQNLSVRCYHYVMYLSVLKLYPGSQQFSFYMLRRRQRNVVIHGVHPIEE
jgi:hypothetical protein